MTPRFLISSLCVMLTAPGAHARDARYAAVADDPHLNILPRTTHVPPPDFTTPHPAEQYPAGSATVAVAPDANAFSLPSANIGFEAELVFKQGNDLFRRIWTDQPPNSDGLGPLFNAPSCQSCHLKDGRGHPPETPTDDAVSMVLRLAAPAITGNAEGPAAKPDPVYGAQLQDAALPGQAAEYRLQVDYSETSATLADGTTVRLRHPTYTAAEPGYGPLHPATALSPRVAPQMIGLGLIEAIPAADILANADPDDSDGDGISGRPSVVWSAEFNRPMLGRFGLKAAMPTVREQTADAFAGDIGLSSSLRPAAWGDCTLVQTACRAAALAGDDSRPFEIDDKTLDLVTFYSRNLAVPARRDVDDPQVLRGKDAFFAAGCPVCHRPAFVTHRLADRPEHSAQLIWPYSDLLLHDMGPGLADMNGDGTIADREWRTQPLWGIGLTRQVSGHSYFLHDGRARSLLEAVLWHGGEAQAARDAVIGMATEDRKALLRFLGSL